MTTDLAARTISTMTERTLSLATAESLTGGLVAAALTSVPGSSETVRGGLVAYATPVKSALLGVDSELLQRAGPVDAEVAVQMAEGAASVFEATFGVATTGEAGPESASGAPVGTVFVAVSGPGGTRVESLQLTGSRAEIRASAVQAALALLRRALSPA